MNTTITNINDNTMNLKVREYTKYLIANRGKLFKAVFTKKNGEEREMMFTIATNWNNLNGIGETTKEGRKMVATKCARNMATVCEKVMDAVGDIASFRPRTLNLGTIKSLVIC